jgi:hypothetical protein
VLEIDDLIRRAFTDADVTTYPLTELLARSRRRRVAGAVGSVSACALLVTLGLTVSLSGSSSNSGHFAISSDDRHRLAQVAQSAARLQNAHADVAWAVATTRDEAQRVTAGAVTADSTPVWEVVVQTREPFVCRTCRGDGPVPSSRYIELTVDANTWNLTDSGIVPVKPDLTPLGQPEQVFPE